VKYGVFVAAVLALAVTGCTDGQEPVQTPVPENEDGASEELNNNMSSQQNSSEDIAATVRYTSSGFTPSNVTINKGQSVRFVDSTSQGVWVGSNDHPDHTKYDGTDTLSHCQAGERVGDPFDSCGAVESFVFTFDKEGSFGYHDHLDASKQGKVIVN
jgi:plastocyanin